MVGCKKSCVNLRNKKQEDEYGVGKMKSKSYSQNEHDCRILFYILPLKKKREIIKKKPGEKSEKCWMLV